MYEYVFKNLLIYFPSVKPRNVKENDVNVNIVDDKSKFSVIALIPNPIEKLSKETPSAKRKVPNLFSFNSLFVGFINSINIWSAISINIIDNIIFVFIGITVLSFVVIRCPSIGIIK